VTFRAFGVKWERYVARRFYGWMAITWRCRVRLAWYLVTDVSPSDWKNPILEHGLSIIQCEMAEFHLSPSGTTHQHVTQAPEPLPSSSLKKEMKCPRARLPGLPISRQYYLSYKTLQVCSGPHGINMGVDFVQLAFSDLIT
jgi:hypothetical protein